MMSPKKGDNVAETGDIVAETGDIVAETGDIVAGVDGALGCRSNVHIVTGTVFD